MKQKRYYKVIIYGCYGCPFKQEKVRWTYKTFLKDIYKGRYVCHYTNEDKIIGGDKDLRKFPEWCELNIIKDK